jgi:phenolic acid decarboxylase
MHLSFRPDRAVVLGRIVDQGQALEFVRDGVGRVSWVQVTGRVAVRSP